MNDLISREAAIEAFEPEHRCDWYTPWIIEKLEELPSVEQEIVRCKDCKHRDPEDKKCDSGHFIMWQLPRDDDWFCADGERREA